MEEFLGTHTPRLDEKGRLFLPASFRAAGRGPRRHDRSGGCLYVFPTDEFHRISRLMQSAPGVVPGGPRLRARVPRPRPPRHPRPAGPGHHPAAAARVRRPRQGVHGHRQRQPRSRSGTPRPGPTTSPRSCRVLVLLVDLGGGGPGPVSPEAPRLRPQATPRPTTRPDCRPPAARSRRDFPRRRARIGMRTSQPGRDQTPGPATHRPTPPATTHTRHDQRAPRRDATRAAARPRAARPRRRAARAGLAAGCGVRRRHPRMGGHAEAILERCPAARLIGMDRDQRGARRSPASGSRRFGDRFVAVHAVYDDIAAVLAEQAEDRGRRHPLRPRRLLPPARRAGARVRLPARRTARHADGPVDRHHGGRRPQHLRTRRPGPDPADLRRGALRRPDRLGHRARAREGAVHDLRPARRAAARRRCPRRRSAAVATRPSAPSRPCASRSTPSWTSGSAPCPRRSRCWPRAAGSRCCRYHSLEDRITKQAFAAGARSRTPPGCRSSCPSTPHTCGC